MKNDVILIGFVKLFFHIQCPRKHKNIDNKHNIKSIKTNNNIFNKMGKNVKVVEK